MLIHIFAGQGLYVKSDLIILPICPDHTVISACFFNNIFPEEFRQNQVRSEKIMEQYFKCSRPYTTTIVNVSGVVWI